METIKVATRNSIKTKKKINKMEVSRITERHYPKQPYFCGIYTILLRLNLGRVSKSVDEERTYLKKT